MITNVKISLSKADRCFLANVIDGKHSTRLAKRAEITEFVTVMLQGVIDKSVLPSSTTKATTGESWRDHPVIKKHAKFIQERIKFHGYRTQAEIDAYTRAFTR